MDLHMRHAVGLLVPPVSILVFLLVKREWRDIPRYLGWKTWGVIAGLCLIWFTGVFIDGGVSYLDNLLFKQTVGRAVNAFTHSRPFWFYAVAILWCIAPYTILLIGGLIAALRRRGPKTVAAGRFSITLPEAIRRNFTSGLKKVRTVRQSEAFIRQMNWMRFPTTTVPGFR